MVSGFQGLGFITRGLGVWGLGSFPGGSHAAG